MAEEVFDAYGGQTAEHFSLKAGRTFEKTSVDTVMDFLASRKLEAVRDDARTFKVVADRGRLVLEHVNNKVRQWPMRHAFFQKLLRWYHVPRKPLYRMEPDAVVPFLNGILQIINKEICVRIEDGDALTVTSPRYCEVYDLDLLKQVKQPVEFIVRTDFLTRVFTRVTVKAEPVPGDLCGFGGNILNSETGFLALQVVSYILRYVCTNGAVAPLLEGAGKRIVHYNVSPGEVENYLEESFRHLNKDIPELVRRLNAAVSASLPDEKKVISSLNEILEFPNGKNLYAQFQGRGKTRLYDLFNFLTEKAKRYSPERQLQMEQYAGRLLVGAGPPAP